MPLPDIPGFRAGAEEAQSFTNTRLPQALLVLGWKQRQHPGPPARPEGKGVRGRGPVGKALAEEESAGMGLPGARSPGPGEGPAAPEARSTAAPCPSELRVISRWFSSLRRG